MLAVPRRHRVLIAPPAAGEIEVDIPAPEEKEHEEEAAGTARNSARPSSRAQSHASGSRAGTARDGRGNSARSSRSHSPRPATASEGKDAESDEEPRRKVVFDRDQLLATDPVLAQLLDVRAKDASRSVRLPRRMRRRARRQHKQAQKQAQEEAQKQQSKEAQAQEGQTRAFWLSALASAIGLRTRGDRADKRVLPPELAGLAFDTGAASRPYALAGTELQRRAMLRQAQPEAARRARTVDAVLCGRAGVAVLDPGTCA